LCSFVAPADADQISQQVTSLKHQAAQLSSQMLLEQLQIGGYQVQYNAALTQLQDDQQQIATLQRSITRNQQVVAHDVTVLQRATVTAYIDGGTTANITPLFSDQRAAGDRSEFQSVLSGTVTGAVDQLQTDRHVLQARQATLQRMEAQHQATKNQSAQLLSQAESTQQALQSQNAQVQGSLAAAVAQQQAQQAQAAAAAVAAAQAKTAAQNRAQSAAQVSPAASAPAGSTAGPSLNGFLQCVIQHESGGDYQIVSPTGQYMGAFQFSQPTWNEAARLAGRPTLIGVPPNQASPADQDALAVALYSADGGSAWYDPCTGR
jgi:septal ring factor EnvC (AmiA/AmiB activator)